MGNSLLRVEHIDVYYGDFHALWDVSLEVEEALVVSIIGANGAGKSTLLLHLNGLLGLPRRAGRIEIQGLSVEPAHLPEIRRRVGLLFQDPDDQLFSATVGEDIAFGPEQLGLTPGEVGDRVRAALAMVNLTGFESRPPHHLSLGEKKRVCLAGVWACQPEVLVFDEPTANFDPRGRREFIDLCHKFPGTKLIASHDLEMILSVCGRVLVLDAGRLVAQGATQQVLGDEPLMLAHGLEKPHSLFHQHPHR